MIHVSVLYNPFTRKLAASIDNEPASPYGAIKRLDGKPFLQWAFRVFDAISQDINEAYELTYVGREVEYEILEKLATNHHECHKLGYQAPDNNQSALQRINILNRLTVNGIAPMLPRRNLEIGVLGSIDIETLPKPIPNRYMMMKFIHILPGESRPDHCVIFSENRETEDIACREHEQIIIEMGTGRRATLRDDNLVYSVNPSQTSFIVSKTLELCVYPELVASWIDAIEKHGGKVDEQILRLREIERRIRVDVPEVMEIDREYPVKIYGDVSAGELTLKIRSSMPLSTHFNGKTIRLSETGNVQVQLYDSTTNMVLYEGLIRGAKRKKVKSLEIRPARIEMTNGDIRDIDLGIIPADADNKSNITWDSSDAFIAYEENGRVVARGEGECLITASCEGVAAECQVAVYPRVQRFEVILERRQIEQGKLTHFRIEQFPKEALQRNYHVRVFPKGVASFDLASKVIQGNIPGFATIEAVDENGNSCRAEFEVISSHNEKETGTDSKKKGLFRKIFGGN